MKLLREERGNVLILSALGMAVLLGFTALAVDVGQMFYTQRQLQTLADSAAMAGALAVPNCSGTADCGAITTAATTAFTESGSAVPALATQCAANSGSGLRLTVNNGPCALGASDPNAGNQNYVEAVVSLQQPTFFETVFGISSVNIVARAEAGSSANGCCLCTIGPSGTTLYLNSGAVLQDAPGSSCGVTDDSNGTPAVMADSGATVTLGSFNVVGTVTNNGTTFGSSTSSPLTGASSVPDPFAAEIASGSLATPPEGAVEASSLVTGPTSLSAGYYPSGINFNSIGNGTGVGTGNGYTVTLASGIYYMGGNVIVGSGVTLSGTGVTIYMASGQLNMNSNSSMNLTAPTTGPTAGLLIWEPASNTSAMNLDSGTNSQWGGAIYVPGAQLTLNGGASAAAYGMVVAQSLMLDGNISLSCTSMINVVCPSGTVNPNGGSSVVALAE